MVHQLELLKYQIRIYAKILHKVDVKLHVQLNQHMNQLLTNNLQHHLQQVQHYLSCPYILNNTNKIIPIEA